MLHFYFFLYTSLIWICFEIRRQELVYVPLKKTHFPSILLGHKVQAEQDSGALRAEIKVSPVLVSVI